MSEIESQVADLETHLKKRTRYSERVNFFVIHGCLIILSVPLLVQAGFILPRRHKSDLDKAVRGVFVEFGAGNKFVDPSDRATVQRGKLTKVLEEHMTSDYAVNSTYCILFFVYFLVTRFTRSEMRDVRLMVQSVRIIKQLQDQSNTAETT